ncbi:sulfotransferase [Aureispira anguillae]|uniref:Sulfotransferase n=1 Tax=Aureispira anguillae TaxID=2864201 RepID=A0A916DWG7_9BACT|nr:sulfotransferase [Aureispira anguillae]BDS14665.1 sulfotransferase [Aureispira anguillae]
MVELTSYFPDFIIVGAAKSGTSSLHRYLSTHPDIYMPKLKELNFMHTYGQGPLPILERFPEMPTNEMAYAGHFYEAKDHQQKGEASPSYLIYYERTIATIKKFYKGKKEPKIIIILREPIDKIWSHFRFNRMHKLDPDCLSLEEALEVESKRLKDPSYLPDVHYIHNTKYLEQVKAYLDNFEEVKVVLFDDLNEHPVKLMTEIHAFLGVKDLIPEDLGKKYNKSNTKAVPTNKMIAWAMEAGLTRVPFPFKEQLKNKLLKKETMDESVRAKLVQIFKPEVEQLQELLGQDLSSWLANY